MKRYEWEAYYEEGGELCADGFVYAYTETEARIKIEEVLKEKKISGAIIKIVGDDFVGCEAARWK